MEEKLRQYIKEYDLFLTNDKFLVAVSGGVDSMVLCRLLAAFSYPFEVAHCNFQLRGQDSEFDETFVRKAAEVMGKKCHVKRFDTEGYARENKIGIQEAARNLRYEWFEELRQTLGFQWIVTAHHASDNIETVLHNFTKGTGLRGMKGISSKNSFVVRPLLWATKNDIETYARVEKIHFRADASNDSDKYTRNFIRHQIVPNFQLLNPSFEQTALENIRRFDEAHQLLDYFIQQIKDEIIHVEADYIFINQKKLRSYPSVNTILYEILKDYNFNNHQVEQILRDTDNKTKVGSKFFSSSHVLLIDRDYFIVKMLKKDPNTEGVLAAEMLIYDNEKGREFGQFKFEINKSDSPPFVISKDKNIALMDFDKLTFPLTLRHWQAGDSFKPLGMNGQTQKLSDYFNQRKLTVFEKENVWLLATANGEICWVINYRTDERFKITEHTTRSYTISYINE